MYYREPNINLGIKNRHGKVPHIVGNQLLQHFCIKPNTREAHALTYLNYEAAEKYGKVGGFAHLATLVKRLRDNYGHEKTLLLDGGDTSQPIGREDKTWLKPVIG